MQAEGKKALPFPDEVQFLKNDLIEFGKSVFRTLKETYKRENDPDAQKKYARRGRHNRRRQRQSEVSEQNYDVVLLTRMQKRSERLEAAAVYKRRNEGADPSPFLLSDFMTELESELETDNELERIGNRSKVLHAANLSPQEKKDEVPVWEVVKKGFRSQEVSI